MAEQRSDAVRANKLELARQKHRALKDELCPVPGHVPHEAIDHAVLVIEGEPPAEIGPPPPILPPLPHTPAPYWHEGMLSGGLTARAGPSARFGALPAVPIYRAS